MMKNLYLTLGACGNKLGINLVERGLIDVSDLKLINSTLKDIPSKYKEYAIRISDDQQGAAQERRRGKEMALKAIDDGRLKLDGICDPQHQKVVILTSLSGGTGSGASVVVAKYLKDVVGIPVEIIGIVGFSNESTRSLRNTIEFCQDLENDYIIQLIRNDAFLAKASGNRILAEQYANDAVARKILIDSGDLIRESIQNIDDMDLLKLETTTGYKMVEHIPVNEKIKNHEQFNYLLKNALDTTASIESDSKGMSRLGVIFNLSRQSQEFIDYSYAPIRERLGEPYEVFNHVNDVESGGKEWISLICTGLHMPIDEIKAIYNEYQRQADLVDSSSDSFFDEVRSFKGDPADNMFDMNTDRHLNSGSKEAFFDSMRKQPAPPVRDEEEPKPQVVRNPRRTKEDFLNSEW